MYYIYYIHPRSHRDVVIASLFLSFLSFTPFVSLLLSLSVEVEVFDKIQGKRLMEVRSLRIPCHREFSFECTPSHVNVVQRISYDLYEKTFALHACHPF